MSIDGAWTVMKASQMFRSVPIRLVSPTNCSRHCSGLASIAIPDSVTSIGDRAFAYCDSLTNVTIGGSVISNWGKYAFYSCDGLTSVTIPDKRHLYRGEGVLYSCEGLTSVTIGDGVTSIGRFAFAYCDSLASVTIGDGVTSLGGVCVL